MIKNQPLSPVAWPPRPAPRRDPDATPVAPPVEFPPEQSDREMFDSIIRNALDDKLKPVVSGLMTLQGQMSTLEKRQQALEEKAARPSAVAYVALVLGLVNTGIGVSLAVAIGSFLAK